MIKYKRKKHVDHVGGKILYMYNTDDTKKNKDMSPDYIAKRNNIVHTLLHICVHAFVTCVCLCIYIYNVDDRQL